MDVLEHPDMRYTNLERFVYNVYIGKLDDEINTKNKVFEVRISSVNVTKSAVSCDLVTFTEDILNGKLHFVCSVS